jgi:prolyl 4-hydroxylase
MNLRQPRRMQNYTELGYKKIRAPKELFSLIEDFWNKNKGKAMVEHWSVANTFT